jgi:hypothetical protein
MRIRRFAHRLVAAALAAVVVTALPSCGGGSDSGGGTTNPTATFTPDTPTPGNATIAMLAGSSSGAAVSVRITVTGVDDFLGAAFRVTYDTTALFFNGMDDSGSVLRQGGVADTALFFEANNSSVAGEVIVTATRLNPAPPPTGAGVVDVGATSDLVVLNFSARRAIPGGDVGGELEFVPAREVQACATPTTCAPATVTWSGGAVTAQ